MDRQTNPLKENYTLIGLEQTSNSVEIQDFDFPKKSVLVLGNEREGIPIDLISYFDAVCEIPQRKHVCNSMSHIFMSHKLITIYISDKVVNMKSGIIRSLNVHVSAALAIWEYSRKN